MTDLLLPFQFEFMRSALLISVLVAIPCALLSCFLVLKGWSLMGDAVSHAVLPGVVIAYIASIPVAVGAFAAGMACAVLVGYVETNSRVKRDTVMGVVFSGFFALGIVLYTQITTEVHLDHILFGDMLGVGPRDLLLSGVIALLVTLAIAAKWRDLTLHSFDPTQARAAGLRTRVLHYGLLAALSLAIVGALKAVGLILAIAIFIAPGAIAFLITRRMGTMLLIATLIAVGASLTGVYASFFIDSAPAPTVVLVMTALFVLAFAYQARRA